MADKASGKPRIVSVQASQGDVAGKVSAEPEQRIRLVAGVTLSIEVQAHGDAMFGLAVGGEHLSAAEWKVSGNFEVIVTNHYAPSMMIHVAVRGPKSEGAEISDWLGPVDDYRVLVYEVEVADRSRAICPSA